MEKLQELLKQHSSMQSNPFFESQNFQMSHKQLVANDNNDDNDESSQEFTKPNNNINNHHETTAKLQQPIPSPIQQKQSTKHEFSVRQSKSQESPQPHQQSPPPVEQPISLQNTQGQQEEALEQQFTRKFRQSWRNTPDNLPTYQLKKATKLSENDISSQGDDEQEDMTEDDIYKLHEELENTRSQNNEMKIALNEARTIIDQQQNQLTEFRRCAAQYQTDAEAFKMKSMFLLNNTQTHDEQVNVLIGACERLEAEIDALTWQLDQTKQSLQLKTQECDFLNEQLDEIQLHGSYHSPHLDEDTINQQYQDKSGALINSDKLKSGTDQYNSILSTEYKSLTGNSQLKQMNTITSELNMNGTTDYNLNQMDELQKLRNELNNYIRKEKEWQETHEELLRKQKLLEEEKRQKDLVIGRLANEQIEKTKSEDSQNDDVQHEQMPSEVIATINNLHVEKTTWKLYASSLVRSFVENCEEFIRKTPYNEPYFESDSERRWYSYSMYLLENLLQTSPYLLSKSDLDLLERNTNHRTRQLTNYHSNEFSTNHNIQRRSNGPELLTSSDFPSSMSRIQLRDSYTGNVQTTELAQHQQVDQGYGSYSRKSKPSQQQKVSERAARAASKPLSHFYRNKK
ncbi:glutamate-cysteine ligase [Schistosoma japonicum]|uniref:Glutamate-cysteine ligase n=1 Tax=Schistosoma japonicum TaxID=6182 RepID=A0A4Z2DES3_SCHJA|nr:glutamate-cysteine ligase [Schistosoma japonicum]